MSRPADEAAGRAAEEAADRAGGRAAEDAVAEVTARAADEVDVVLAVDPERFAEVARALPGAGLTLQSEQQAIGTVRGRVAASRIAELESIDGVDAVEQERRFHVAPPDSPLQ